MTDKKPFDKEHPTKIPFSELVELIGTSCDYKFCIIDENIDDELFELAARHGIDLTGYKHVIETTGIQHSEKRHGSKSEDRTVVIARLFVGTLYHQGARQGGNVPSKRCHAPQ